MSDDWLRTAVGGCDADRGGRERRQATGSVVPDRARNQAQAAAGLRAEELRARLRPMDDGENLHARRVRSSAAFVAACEMRASGLCGSWAVALLLKSANACSAWPASSRSVGTHSASSSSEYR